MFEEGMQDVDTTQNPDGLGNGVDNGEGAGSGTEPSRGELRFQAMANENRELRDRIARMEGMFAAQPKEEQPEPEFDTEEERYLYKLTKHSEVLAQKLSKLEEKEQIREREAQRNDLLRSATRGIKYSNASFARESLELWVSTHPKASEADVRSYAKRLSAALGSTSDSKDGSGKTYIQQKEADIAATKRPSQSVLPKAPVAPEGDKKPMTWADARASAMRRIAAANGQ